MVIGPAGVDPFMFASFGSPLKPGASRLTRVFITPGIPSIVHSSATPGLIAFCVAPVTGASHDRRCYNRRNRPQELFATAAVFSRRRAAVIVELGESSKTGVLALTRP